MHRRHRCNILGSLLRGWCDFTEWLETPDIRIVPVVGLVTERTTAVVPTPQFQGRAKGELLMAKTITATQQFTLSVQFVDRKGNPAPVQGAPVWLVDNPNVLALTPAPDGLSCLVAAVGPLGVGLVSLSADADLGDGVTTISGTSEVTVVAGAAVTVELMEGPEEEQSGTPPPPPPPPPAP